MRLKLAVLALIVSSPILLASIFIPYNNAKPPTLSLPDAYARALVALGPATNQIHCIKAEVATSFSPDGEWFFTFYSTNSTPKPKWVTVEFNGKVHIEDIILR